MTIPDLIQYAAQIIHEEAFKQLEARGFTAHPVMHLWCSEDAKTADDVDIRRGYAPKVEARPDHLKTAKLEIFDFKLPGVVRKQKGRYIRTKK